ncbi:hypothetical protein F2Q69_00023607 [Brassica cretica]|uniref:Uncharacterized protein n=1 Tax=Brassica cretica TaxID=69181 RepID=A0A8S9QMJ1_BRACR|nr:hypothetical protein F2Q69_00023607 [Brassica cretica]
MRGSPYRKFSIFWKGPRFQGPKLGFLLAGTWSIPLSGTRGSGSCLEAGGNDTGIFFPNRGIDQQSGSFSQVATPRSVVGSRFSEEPSF